jgi:hypothetical protein
MATFYLDYGNGSDGYTAKPLGWWVLNASQGTGSFPTADSCILGATSGAYAYLTIDASRLITPGDSSVYLYGKQGDFQLNETVYTIGGNFKALGNAVYCAWNTISNGALAARINPGDIIRIAKSPAPTYLCDASWYGSGPNISSQGSFTSTTNTAPIAVTKTNHGYSTGTVVQILGHSINPTANGNWIIDVSSANIFTLRDSSGIGNGSSSGSIQDVTRKAVILDSPKTLIINNAGESSIGWYGANGSTIAYTGTTKGNNAVQITISASNPSTNTLLAYSIIPTKNASAYQKLSFQFYNSAAISQNNLKLCLCSDTSGLTIVNSFKIPAITNLVSMGPLTLSPSEGGNLSSNINSVALYTDSSTNLGSKVFRLDNIMACTSTGINLQSLISKGPGEQITNEGWFAIQSINREIVLIDNLGNRETGRGYYGKTECTSTFIRESIKTPYPAVVDTVIHNINKAGTTNNLIEYTGGYDKTTNLQNGETIFDGLLPGGFALNLSGMTWNKFDRLSFYRYYAGVIFQGTAGYHVFQNMSCCHIYQGPIYLVNTCYNLSFTNVKVNNNSGSAAIYFYGGSTKNSVFSNMQSNNNNSGAFYSSSVPNFNNTFTDISTNNNGYAGIYLATSSYNKFNNIVSERNANYGVFLNSAAYNYFANSVIIRNPVGFYLSNGNKNRFFNNKTIDNSTGFNFLSSWENNICSLDSSDNVGIIDDIGVNYFNNSKISGPTEITISSNLMNARIYSQNHDQTPDNHYIVSDQGYIISDNSIRHTPSGLSWKLVPTSLTRNIDYPLDLTIGKFALEANRPTVIKAWFKLGGDSSIGAQLICKADPCLGLSFDVSVAAAATTNWQELSLNITTSATGVVEIQALAYWNTALGNVWVDDITVI